MEDTPRESTGESILLTWTVRADEGYVAKIIRFGLPKLWD